MKRLLVLLLLLVGSAVGNVHTVATITGTGASVQVSTDNRTRATWISVSGDKLNSAAVMFGDSTVTSTVGIPVAAGGNYETPTCGNCVYTLSAHWVYVANGDKAYVAFGD